MQQLEILKKEAGNAAQLAEQVKDLTKENDKK